MQQSHSCYDQFSAKLVTYQKMSENYMICDNSSHHPPHDAGAHSFRLYIRDKFCMLLLHIEDEHDAHQAHQLHL